MIDDVIVNKTETIKRCIRRILEEYGGDERNLHHITKQDSIVLNLQRACEAAIDLAMHVVAERGIGVPQSSRDAFALLEREGMISAVLSYQMKAMVGFRNIAVHDYQALQLPVLKSIVERHLDDFTAFAACIRSL